MDRRIQMPSPSNVCPRKKPNVQPDLYCCTFEHEFLPLHLCASCSGAVTMPSALAYTQHENQRALNQPLHITHSSLFSMLPFRSLAISHRSDKECLTLKHLVRIYILLTSCACLLYVLLLLLRPICGWLRQLFFLFRNTEGIRR